MSRQMVNINNKEYEVRGLDESLYVNGRFLGVGVVMLSDFEHADDEEIRKIVSDILYDLKEKTSVVLWHKDPEVIKKHQEQKDSLIKCFRDASIKTLEPKEKPNPYSKYNSPALDMPTDIGVISVHWRKRVIELAWERSIVELTAEELFPDEDVTKDGQLIHAWGYEKLTEYLKKLRESVGF